MAIFRSVENSLPIFRQTGTGVSVVTEAYGRAINRVDMFEEESTGQWGGEQMVITPVGSIETLYPIIGDAARFVRPFDCCMDKAEINYRVGGPSSTALF